MSEVPGMKNVLIALDYDETAVKLAERGYRLAQALNGRCTLLHVISDPTYYSSLNYSPIVGFVNSDNAFETDTVEAAWELSEKYLAQLKQHLGDEGIGTIVATGQFAETILETATQLNADLIVMATHSRRGLEKMFAGSVAEKVLSNSLIPLLIIPTKTLELEK